MKWGTVALHTIKEGYALTQHDVSLTIAQAAQLTEEQAGKLIQATFTSIARELSVGEPVHIEGLGKFFILKLDPEEGQAASATPETDVEFEPDSELADFIAKQIEKHPDLFPDEEEEVAEEKEETKADEPSGPLGQSMVSTPFSAENLPDMPDDDAAGKDKKEAKDGDKPEAKEESKNEAKADEAAKSAEESTSDVTPLPEAGAKAKAQPGDKPLGRASSIEFMDVAHLTIEKDVLALVPQSMARQYSVVPIDLKEGTLKVGMIDPEDFDALQILRKETGLAIQPVLTTKEDLSSVLDQYTGLQAELEDVIEHSDLGITEKDVKAASQEDLQDQTNENAPTAKIVYSLLRRAVKEHASDVHIEPYEGKVIVRFRIDGVLMVKVELPKEIQSAIISRLKILANLKIDEQRLPQDGRFNLIVEHRQVDFRLSTIPVVYGEKVVMRILDKSVGIISLEEVGLSDRGLEVLSNNMKKSHGMILVTGPTGSGKTTSLYAVLGKLMSPNVNILTLEDPVEYRIESINQSQVHSDIGYSFAAGLRAAVRQDPDIVMLGEIRDQETADMAIHAALTGHIVLSTLHTNDAAGAFPRLIDMHIEPFLITSSVHTVIAQRLARKVCDECREELELSKAEMDEIKEEVERMPAESKEVLKKEGASLKFFHGKGCDRCGGKGYKGRIGVFEVLNVTEPIRELVMQRSSGAVITAQAIKEGMVTMPQDGIIKAARGLTTIEEVWRVTRE